MSCVFGGLLHLRFDDSSLFRFRTEAPLLVIVIGRKNHYGSRSKRGTEVAALYYSLVETAKLNNVDPADYLYSQRTLQPTEKEVKFIAFTTNTCRIILGLCEFLAGPTRTIEFDIERMRASGSGFGDVPFELREGEYPKEGEECEY